MPAIEKERALKKNNVLLSADYRSPQSGNFIASVLDLADWMQDKGSKLFFLFPQSSSDHGWVQWIRSRGYTVFFISDRISAQEKQSFFRKLIEDNQIRLIHTHFGFQTRFLLDNHKSFGVELLIHDHMDFTADGNPIKQRIMTMARAASYRLNDAYGISVMKKKDRYYWPAGRKRHWFIINGLSSKRANYDRFSIEERRKEIGLKENEKLVLFLGWDMYRKGLDLAIKAVEEYRKTDPTLKLGVIGVSSDGKPSDKAQQFLEQRGIDPNSDAIIYMHSYEDIFALNRAIDCYISSSRAEAFAYGILEAISQNTPVVVSNIAGTSWSWEYDKCFTYKTEDTEDCVRALRRAIAAGRSPSNYMELTRRYGNDVWCDRIAEIYQRILN